MEEKMATKIIIDSASDITKEEADNLGIILLPIEIQFDNEGYLDGVNITKEEFYTKLEKSINLPKTSQISPLRYREMFDEVTANGDEAVVICLSSKLSGTYNGARLTAQDFEGKIFVVDSQNACIGQRILCFYAIELLKKGYNAEKIAKELDKVKSKIRVLAVIDTLKYLRKGGRISSVAAIAGELMSIKPLICVTEEGTISVIGKAMGYKKGHKMLIDLVAKYGEIDKTMPYVLGYSGNDMKNMNEFISNNVSELFDNPNDVPVFSIGSTIGTHIGPGAVAISYFAK